MGMLIGAGSAILLVLVSPNMTYPLKVLADANSVMQSAPQKIAAHRDMLMRIRSQEAVAGINKQITELEKSIVKANEDIAKYQGQTTSIMGLEKPLFRLKNPGIISIPLGFLMVILFSLLTRDKRSEDLWEELYVRQNTGLHVEDVSH